MTYAERIFKETQELPEQAQQQVLDFTLFLKQKQRLELEADMDAIIHDNLEAFQELAK